MRIQATSPTLGRSARGEHKPYRYGGTQPFEPEPAPRPETRAQTSRAARIRRYAELRAEGKTPQEAGEILGVCWSTARDYEQALKDAGEQEAQAS